MKRMTNTPPDTGIDPLVDGILAKACAHGQVLDDFNRCGQSAGAQHNGQIRCLGMAEITSDLSAATQDFSRITGAERTFSSKTMASWRPTNFSVI